MNAIDDPAVPDDLRDLLRAGSADLTVSPAALGSVQRRVRQRRRRRRALVASGAAAVVLLAGLAVAQVGRPAPGHERVLATSPPATDPSSVPQPLLVRREWKASEVPAGTDPNDRGWTLDSLTPAGTSRWWGATSGWHPVGGYELADGRRFGVAATMPTGLGVAPKARLDEISADATTVSSRPLPLEVPWGSFDASIRPIGATGDEIVLQRDVKRSEPIDDVFFKVAITTTYTAIDVDSGVERPLFEVDGTPGSGIPAASAAAADVVVRAEDDGCGIVVSSLTGDDPRRIAGSCPQRPVGMSGFGIQVTVSPDGRRAAVVWTGTSAGGLGVSLFEVIDLERGESIGTAKVESASLGDQSWTGVRQLSIAVGPDREPIEIDAGDVAVRSIAS
ncbi:MAG TPA: hypothetical protein VNS19_20905 [Acidimicrobiales bacterium]|nr:hypothetical protein [Acidimicrobiales bacterium]